MVLSEPTDRALRQHIAASIPISTFVCTHCGYGRRPLEDEREAFCDSCTNYMMIPVLSEVALLDALVERHKEQDALIRAVSYATSRLGVVIAAGTTRGGTLSRITKVRNELVAVMEATGG